MVVEKPGASSSYALRGGKTLGERNCSSSALSQTVTMPDCEALFTHLKHEARAFCFGGRREDDVVGPSNVRIPRS